MTDPITPYPDGRWTVGDHPADQTETLWCRGNVGEVFPNVVTPLSASLYRGAMDRGQVAAAREWGMLTDKQVASLVPDAAWLTGVFAGYLYGNVTAARSAVARTPGLTVQLVDTQMFGLSDAPPHERQPGERDPRAAVRSGQKVLSTMRRPESARLRADQADIARYVAKQPEVSAATDDRLLDVARALPIWAERMMHHLLSTSSAAGISRSLLERMVASIGEPGLENRLTAGLGTVESALPARALWDLGRRVEASSELTRLFDDGVDGLDARLRASPAAASFVDALTAFRDSYGWRGPDEWELASPTWGTDPSLSLAMIDALRRAPAERDPLVAGTQLAAQRATLLLETRARLSSWTRPLFDRASRATAVYAAMREGTKAAFMRAVFPTRRALAELGRRSGLPHDDYFLLTFHEAEAATRGSLIDAADLDERRARRDFLQARNPPFWFAGSAMPDPSSWPLRADQKQPDDRARTITGMGVCPGVATGVARVVMHPNASRDLGPGDILVAPITDPAWTPLFLAAAGVVVDVGAQQSHAAIVSRELGIPAVVSATGASATIRDGAWITVDGTHGTVTVHADDA